MTIVLLDEAQDRFKAEDSWWREHRDARELFVTEFQDMVRQVAAAPGIGQRYRRARGKLIQRVLMKKTRCHVYYFHERGARHARDSLDLGCSPHAGTTPVVIEDPPKEPEA